MRRRMPDILLGAIWGLVASIFIIGGLALWIGSKSNDVIICPPLIDRSLNLQLTFGWDVDMTPTELDLEFAEACGLTWQDPVRVVPPEDGA